MRSPWAPEVGYPPDHEATGRAALAALLTIVSAAACTQMDARPVPAVNESATSSAVPMLVRFVSDAPATRNQVCYGVVTDARDGVPREVRIIFGSEARPLCEPRDASLGPRAEVVAQLARALTLLDDPLVKLGEPQVLAPDELPARVLAPVPVNEKWLDDATWPNENKVFIVGAGLNYGAHAEEVGGGNSILFPKPIVPTGAYALVPVVQQVLRNDTVCLLDYEAEIAFVVLEDIDLENLPTGHALWSKLAFFAVNDVSDREPIILDDKTGYTKGKARPGFLPSGPWLIAGWHLVPTTNEGGTEPLLIGLSTREKSDTGSPWINRQLASSAEMIIGPRAILELLRERDPQGEPCRRSRFACTMDDMDGSKRYMFRGGVLPAGSIVLTGTPGGTALKAPGLLEKLGFLLRSGNPKAARQLFLEEQIHNRSEHSYLEPGDQVDQVIERLGRQSWRIGSNSSAIASCTNEE